MKLERMLNFSDDTKRKWLYVLGSILILYFVFAPAVNLLFHTGEDLRYVFGGEDKSCATDDGFYFVKTLGRPLQAYMDCFNYKYGNTLEKMRMIRLLSVALMGVGMGLLAELFYTFGLSFLGSFFTAGAIFMIPKLYGDTIELGATSLPFAVLFVIISYRCLARAQLIYAHKEQGRPRLWLAFSSMWLLAALLTYPAMTFLFCTLILVRVLFSRLSDWKITKAEVARETILFISVCVGYFIWAYLNMRFNPQAPVPDAYRLDHPTLNPFEIIHRLLPLLNPFDGAWRFLPYTDMSIQGYGVIFILLIGVIAAASRALQQCFKKPAMRQDALQIVFYVAVLYVFSCGFYLVMPVRDSLGSRLVFAASASNAVLLLWALNNYSFKFSLRSRAGIASVSTVLVAAFFAIQSWQANSLIMVDSLSSSLYLNRIVSTITDYTNKNAPLKRLHFISLRGEYPYNNFFLASGAMSQIHGPNNFHLKWCSLQRGVVGEEKDHQAEMFACLNNVPENTIAVTYSYSDEPYTKTDKMLVVKPEYVHIDVANWYT